MELIPKNHIIEFNPDTLQAVRKEYNLDQPGRMEEAINILDEWVKKQEHFIRKNFSREYIERLIIRNKGSLEKAKLGLDKMCTLRTLMPHYYGSYNPKKDFQELKLMHIAALPKLTPDNYRLYFTRNSCKELSNTFFLNYHRLIICESYPVRVTGIHVITTSKFINVIISILKQILSAKMINRIHIHANIEALHNIVPRDILPSDYGGKEKSLLELYDDWLNIISTEEHMEYMKNINAAKTDESRRLVATFNEQHLGTPGTFRSMVLD